MWKLNAKKKSWNFQPLLSDICLVKFSSAFSKNITAHEYGVGMKIHGKFRNKWTFYCDKHLKIYKQHYMYVCTFKIFLLISAMNAIVFFLMWTEVVNKQNARNNSNFDQLYSSYKYRNCFNLENTIMLILDSKWDKISPQNHIAQSKRYIFLSLTNETWSHANVAH